MIPREDFAVIGRDDEVSLDLIREFPLANLTRDSSILKLLRKPDFQRETNHWTPEQVASFIESFVENEVIPSLILWKSPDFVFVIDGGHRLSALRAWVEDDYGDRTVSREFYDGEISEEQKRVAKRTRTLVETKVGRYSTLRDLVGVKDSRPETKRAVRMTTRGLPVQWIQGNAEFAESSFFKINSQGTPLDQTETLLIRNRRKPIAIAARAILRSGAGHKYWSSFDDNNARQIVEASGEFYKVLFQPEVSEPVKTVDLPIGGSVSPVDALALLIEFLSIAGSRDKESKSIDKYPDDDTGAATIEVLSRANEVVKRITGTSAGSLGLHPAVYFYTEKGKYNRFLFLGMTMLITEAIRNNDQAFFKKFTLARSDVETFLRANKSLIGIILQNLAKGARVHRMRDLLRYLVSESIAKRSLDRTKVIGELGLRGEIIDVVNIRVPSAISDDTKAIVAVQKALESAQKCPECGGLLLPTKSVSYDHKKRVRNGGTGEADNVQMCHPFCNTGMKN